MHVRFIPAFAALVALSACSSSRPPWADGAMIQTVRPADAGPQDLSNLQGRLLALHNRERAAVGVPALRWDARLAADAAGMAFNHVTTLYALALNFGIAVVSYFGILKNTTVQQAAMRSGISDRRVIDGQSRPTRL